MLKQQTLNEKILSENIQMANGKYMNSNKLKKSCLFLSILLEEGIYLVCFVYLNYFAFILSNIRCLQALVDQLRVVSE